MLLLYLNSIEDPHNISKFEQLYLLYREKMYWKAYNILQDNYLAEDAVHDAFLRIAKYMDSITEIDCNKTAALLVIIVKNISIDIYRKRKKCNYVSLEEGDSQVFYTENPTDSLDEQQLIRYIKELPDNYRDILILKYYIGYKNKEIANYLNVKESSVRVRIMRGKKLLEKKLNGDDYFETHG